LADWRGSLAKAAQLGHEVSVIDHDRIARVRVLVEALGQEHDRAHVHGPAPELRERVALDAHVLDVLRVLRLRDWRNLLVEREAYRLRAGGVDADLDRHVVEIPRRRVPMLPFAVIHVELDGAAVGSMEGVVSVEHRLYPVVTGRDLCDAREGIAERGSVDDRVFAWLEPVDVYAKGEL